MSQAVKSSHMPTKLVYLLLFFSLAACSLYDVVEDCVQEQLVYACRNDEAFARETEHAFDFKQCMRTRERASIRMVCAKGLAGK
jgi:hypothetical protein